MEIKPIKHFMTLHSNIGFNSEGSEDIETERRNYEKSPVLATPLSTMPHQHGTPENIRMSFLQPESRVPGLHFAADSMGLSSLKFLW